MLQTMQQAFDDAARDQHHCAETEMEEHDDELSVHQIIFDDELCLNDEMVLDIVETKQSRYQREVLRRAGWLKDEREEKLSRTANDLLAERVAKFAGKRFNTIKKGH